jgi:hypothetical protein
MCHDDHVDETVSDDFMFPPFSTKFVTLQTHKGQVDVIAFAVELN